MSCSISLRLMSLQSEGLCFVDAAIELDLSVAQAETFLRGNATDDHEVLEYIALRRDFDSYR